MRRLLTTLCSLGPKVWTATELDQLQGDVIMALCEVEAYLPVTEMDLKLHALIHLPEKIRQTGPLWVTAMWVYESMWKQLLRFSRNQASPELSILRGFADFELATFCFWAAPDQFAVKAIKDFQDEFVQETSLRYNIPRAAPMADIEYDGGVQHMKPDNDTLLALHQYYMSYDTT
jgi:hypothetical protein